MKIFTIGTEVNDCCGHGDYRDDVKILREDEKFPPAFTSYEEAKKHLDGMRYKYRKAIVEIELIIAN